MGIGQNIRKHREQLLKVLNFAFSLNTVTDLPIFRKRHCENVINYTDFEKKIIILCFLFTIWIHFRKQPELFRIFDIVIMTCEQGLLGEDSAK